MLHLFSIPVSKAAVKDSGVGKDVGAVERHVKSKCIPNKASISQKAHQVEYASLAFIECQKIQGSATDGTGLKRLLVNTIHDSPSDAKKVKVLGGDIVVRDSGEDASNDENVFINNNAAETLGIIRKNGQDFDTDNDSLIPDNVGSGQGDCLMPDFQLTQGDTMVELQPLDSSSMQNTLKQSLEGDSDEQFSATLKAGLIHIIRTSVFETNKFLTDEKLSLESSVFKLLLMPGLLEKIELRANYDSIRS